MRVGNGCIWGLAAAEAMSALGQKRTCAAQKVMSALPPKADIFVISAPFALRRATASAVHLADLHHSFASSTANSGRARRLRR